VKVYYDQSSILTGLYHQTNSSTSCSNSEEFRIAQTYLERGIFGPFFYIKIKMVLSAIFFLDQKGKILISRNYRGDVTRTAAERFASIINATDPAELKPVFLDGGVNYVYIQHNNVYIVALTRKNSNVLTILVFLERLVEIMKEYFGSLEEESIRDNFVLVYELLDEVMDHGYPQIAEAKVLKEYITQGANKLQVAKPPQAVTNVVSWRTADIKYKKNEVFLDVIERLNILVAANGQVISSEIIGSIKMRSYLTGMPELKLGLNDKALFDAQGKAGPKKAVEMEDIKFHQCVRLTRFESDRTISFIPPDGDFELMSYRINTQVKPLVWVETVIETKGRSRVEYLVKAKTQFKTRSVANNVEILIPVPPDVDSPAFKASIGTVAYVPDLDCIRWSIKAFHGGKEALMRAHFGLPSVSGEGSEAAAGEWRKKCVAVKFEIPYFTVSGIQVRYLKILEKSGYDALPWVRYLVNSGEYNLRISPEGRANFAARE
jgi:AP-1 complex subunit mu